MAAARSIEPLLDDLHQIVRRDAPHLERLLEIFAQEARVGREWLAPSLDRLAAGAALLEIGAGLMLLSCQLAKEGFRVTALEPVGDGFSSFTELQKIVLAYAAERSIAPEVLPIPVEELTEDARFDLAYSINVMEHVQNFALALANVARAVRRGCEYRFICANYLFPYEPHFDIPIVFSKALTERIFRRRIYSNTRVGDAAGLWNSLNWITVPKITRTVRNLPDVSVSFDRSMLQVVLLRAVSDRQFAERRSPFIIGLAKAAVRLGLHRVAKWIPAFIQPVMDCSLKRSAEVH